MTIGIIGYGVVGKAWHNFCLNYHIGKNYLIYDVSPIKEKVSLKKLVLESDFIFVCVPTPKSKNSDKCDLSIIDKTFEDINEILKDLPNNKIVVIKSTVPVGTTDNYNEKYSSFKTCFMPEFLTEKDLIVSTNRLVVGGDKNTTHTIASKFLGGRFFPDLVSAKEAEIIKYMSNAILSIKVIFANEVKELCDKLLVDYSNIEKIVGRDHRIGNSHLSVTEIGGFGGKCFPKDILSFMETFKEHGVDCSLLKTAWEKNLRIRKTNPFDE